MEDKSKAPEDTQRHAVWDEDLSQYVGTGTYASKADAGKAKTDAGKTRRHEGHTLTVKPV
jgi:hypothetical protein